MAEWFHRNPLKATSFVTFELRGIATNGAAQKICSELRQTRNQLLEMLSNPSNQTDVIISTLNNYLGLLHGFVVSLDEGGGDSKLRHAIQFRWSNTLLGNTTVAQSDAVYEKICLLFNVALWFSKHASALAGKDDPKMEEALQVHKCLRVASGLFTLIKKELIGQLKEQPTQKATDLDPNILDAYIHQCTAEAQEVTIARAIELKHSASIVSSLAHETAKLYRLADAALTSVNDRVCLKWQKYLQFKAEIYYAYAYSYHGETLLAQDKCGEAIKCLQESQSHYDKATEVVREYSSAKGAGKTAKPQDHLFFRRLGPIVQRTLDKCIHENGFIYHQKVPPATPDLEEKAAFGVATPEEFQMPPSHSFWTVETYRAFDAKKLPTKQDKPPATAAGEKAEPEVAPVKEKEVPQPKKDPSTSSGCTLS